jgi:hypothetical protein
LTHNDDENHLRKVSLVRFKRITKRLVVAHLREEKGFFSGRIVGDYETKEFWLRLSKTIRDDIRKPFFALLWQRVI